MHERNDRDNLYYQYRTFDGFWAIVQSDSLWLTNARFSNDDEEQTLGIKQIDSILRHLHVDDSVLDECRKLYCDAYISCFCGECDRLSQWRGYAPNGGVSIGFDLDRETKFSILTNDISSAAQVKEGNHRIVRQSAVHDVEYINLSEELTEQEITDKVGGWRICKIDIAGKDIISDKAVSKKLAESIPYIKHKGFEEEMEKRLVFTNNDRSLDSCLRYRKSESPAVQIPYIIVCCGDPLFDSRECIVRTAFPDARLVTDLQNALDNDSDLHGCTPMVFDCLSRKETDVLEQNDALCFGCSRKGNYDIGHRTASCKGADEYALRVDDQDIYISQGKKQKQVCLSVRKWLAANNDTRKVWCEGHLPIRKIVIGPCPNKAEVEESISYYCKHTYWLQDVEIIVSQIPYRQHL